VFDNATNRKCQGSHEKWDPGAFGNQLGIAIVNATRAISLTYQMTANAFSVCREGIVPLDAKLSQFLISKKFIFTPHDQPLSEFDFEEAPDKEKAPSGDWLKEGLAVSLDVDDLMKAKDREHSILQAKVNLVLQQQVKESAMSATLIVFDSQMLLSPAQAKPLLFSSYPFSNVPLPKGQLIYYCQDAMRTGLKPQVTWSVLIRNLAASWLEGNAGEPMPSADEDWCKQRGQAVGACPGLITEFQLRSPLPVLEGIRPGSIIRNQVGQSASQIPPLAPEVL